MLLLDRLVFIDEGYITADAFAVFYSQQNWFDDPPVRHGSGTCVTFADGRAEYHKWKTRETVKYGIAQAQRHSTRMTPTTVEGKEDLRWLQRGTWGKLHE